MSHIYFAFFVSALVLSFIFTLAVIKIARREKIWDEPDRERRFHKRTTPTLGGLAVFGSFFFVTLILGIFHGDLLHGNIPINILVGIWISGLVLMVGGYFDDRYHLPAKISVIFPILASIAIILAGVRAVSVHNPLNNAVIFLTPLVSGLVVFLWTMTMTYTTKLLDGMDGLVTGISAIGALVIFGLSLTPQVNQSQTAILAITFAGSLLGFLILNFHPAKIFLGESGSTLAGFMLAVLAIVSGGKIATALLVMGIPLLDMIWVILQRLINHQSIFSGDRKHLHFKLTEIGLSETQAVLFLYALTGVFGLSGLFLQSRGKFIAFLILICVMLAIIASIFSVYRQKDKSN